MRCDWKDFDEMFSFLSVVVQCDVTGKILMKCFLSGMPDLKLGLNDKIGLEKETEAKVRPSRRLVAHTRNSSSNCSNAKRCQCIKIPFSF
jgi:hypothetical protein